MAGTPKWYGWYEEKEVSRRQESIKRDEEDGHFPPKPKKPETVQAEARDRKYNSRSNLCTSCFMTIAIGQAECECGGHRPVPPKKFSPRGGRTV